MLSKRLQRSGTIPLPTRAYLRRAQVGEIKAVDLAQANYALDSTGTVTTLNLIRTGTSFNNRIGRRIKLRSVYIQGQIANSGAAAVAGTVRILLVHDKQANGAVPTYADVIASVDQAGTATSAFLDHMNMNNRDRFNILVDRKIHMPTLTASVSNGYPSTDALQTKISIFKKLNFITQYKSDTAPSVIGDISTGSLLMLTFGVATSGWVLTATVRTKFIDT